MSVTRDFELNSDWEPGRGQKYECPLWVEAFLGRVKSELDEAMLIEQGDEYVSPFENYGPERFENKVFIVEGNYRDLSARQQYNFKWGDVEISWICLLGGHMSINQVVSLGQGKKMLYECVQSIRDLEKDLAKKKGLSVKDLPRLVGT